MVDMRIAQQAYSIATAVGASPKVILSLFEAGLVESEFSNTVTGDHDSVGYLQQRPSMGWPNPLDVTTATKSYLTRAIANDKKKPTMTAGQLAQSVQISAYPDKYDKRENDALGLLATVSGGKFASKPGQDSGATQTPFPDVVPDGLVGAVQDAAGALKGMVTGAQNIGALANQLMKLALPSNAVRAVSGGLGIVLIFAGIVLIGREVRG